MRMCFDTDWRFHLGEEPTTFWSEWLKRSYDDAAWRRLDVPHDWSIELPRDPKSLNGSEGGFFVGGVGWYRKRFDVPKSWEGKRVAVTFDGVFKNAEVWVNEGYVGRHPYGYASFTMDITQYLEVGAENLLVVRVDNSAPRHSRWYSGSGIYRHVWLLVRDPLHIADGGIYVTTPEVSAESAVVRLEATVVNESPKGRRAAVRWVALGPEGEDCGAREAEAELPPGARHVFVAELPVANPRLWSPDHPWLYRLRTEISAGGEVVEAEDTSFGIREIRYSATEGFVLNGEPLTMRGGCVHHDCGPLGAMSIDRAEERKVELLKASGFNAVRCAHNPPASAFLDACDRLGMLVIDEAFDNWRERATPTDNHLVFDDWWERDLDSMLYRDRNHPCIVMWSIGNEVKERGLPWGAGLARRLAERVRAVDPTRPVTSAVNNWPDWERVDAFFAELDVCGYNYLVDRYEADHERHPDRIIVATETFPSKAFEYWRAAERLPYVVGDFVWTSMDYLGEAGIGGSWIEGEADAPAPGGWLPGWPWHQAFCGDLDICGWKRPPSYYRDILWGQSDALYIGVHTPVPEGAKVQRMDWGWPDVQAHWTWPGMEGREVVVDVYSACDEVELLLNGRPVGRKALSEEDRLIASFTVTYEPGTLAAVGYRAGAKVAEQSLVTCGPAVGLRLVLDRNPIRADRNDLAYVTVEAVDAEGRPAPTADHVVYFTTAGVGHIAALGSNNPRHTEAYRGNRHRLFRGRCLVILRPDGDAGDIHLRAQADDLAPAEAVVAARPCPQA